MTRYHTVTRGNVDGRGTTKSAAKADLDKHVDFLCQHGNGGATLECRYGLLIVVAAYSEGFQYTIIDPSTLTHGKVFWSSCTFFADDTAEALNDARFAACQRAWALDVPDDAAFVALSGCSINKQRDLLHVIDHWRTAKAA